MDLNYRAIFRSLGYLLTITGLLMILPFIVAMIYQEMECQRVFLCVGTVTGIIGASLTAFINASPVSLRMRDGFLLVAVSWLLVSAISAVPFYLCDAFPSYADAFFESCSGFTTTGGTVLSDVESLPRAILFWRSFAHWIGGMGILVFTIALMPEMGIGGQNIARAETPGPIFSKVSARMTDTARYLYIMYAGYTVVEMILLLLGGMDLFESLIHTFGTVGTGGFSMYNDSIAHFNSPYIEVVITVFMLLSGASFNLFFLVLTTGLSAFLRDAEFKLYILIYALSSFLIAVGMAFHSADFWTALRMSSFQVASLLTTTGYATSNYIMWPTFCQMILLLLFFCGGCSGSTSSGIKVIRILVLLKALRSNIRSKLHPNALATIKVDQHTIPTEMISTISSYVFLYIGVMFVVGCELTIVDGLNMVDGLSTAASCLGNVGPAFGEMGPEANYGALSAFSKYLLSFTMITGRLELYTIMLLFSRRFWNPYRY